MKLKLSHKILGLTVGAAMLAGFAIVGVAAYESSQALMEQARQKLETATDARRDWLEGYLKEIKSDVSVLSSNEMAFNALAAFGAGWKGIQGSQESLLQKLYIESNPNPQGEREKLDMAGDGSVYSAVHGRYHPWLRSFARERGYYDVFLIDRDGNVIYSVFKEPDFASNVKDGRWKDTDLAEVYRKAIAKPAEPQFVDFKAYAPSNGAPAAFIGKAVVDKNGSVAGVLVFQMPVGRINDIMNGSVHGMGETGEVYIVGSDFLMRSDSRLSKESTLLKQKVDTQSVREGLDGKDGVTRIIDYRGSPVLSAYTPMEYLGAKYAVVGEIDEAEVLAPLYDLLGKIALMAILVLGVVAVVAVVISRGITVPLGNLLVKIGLLEKGDKNFDVAYMERSDELGDLARALESFRQTAIKQDQLAEEQRREQVAKEQRQIKIAQLIKGFEEVASKAVSTVASAATELGQTARQMSSIISSTSDKASEASVGSQQTMKNVQTVASATEEMSASVQEISARISDSTKAVAEAVSHTQEADKAATMLSDASLAIDSIVSTIEKIAEQVNLLALNATIESARAGEAGKGFSVVSNEIKVLANQTTKATGEISEQVENIKNIASIVTQTLGSIKLSIASVDEYSTNISSAVEQQSAVTTEVSCNMQTAAEGVSGINGSIGAVSNSAREAEESTREVLSAAEELSRQAEILKSEVSSFLGEIRAA